LSCISVHQQQGCKQLTINYLSKLQDIFVLLPHVYLLWSRLTIETNPQLDTNKIHFPQHIVSCIHSLTMFRLNKCLCSNECPTNLILRANIPNAHLFLGHSFRKGGATSLHEAGHPDSLIKMIGRWSSFAFATYIDTPLHMLIEAGQSLRKVVQPYHVPTNDSFWDVTSLQ
jgi:hypothetical protein